MKFRHVVGAALLVGLTAPVSASVQEDVRCVLLSGMFAKGAKEERGKQLARVTGAFYLGRLNGRADSKTIASTMQAESKTINKQNAGSLMQTCAKKLQQAEKAMNDSARSLSGK